MKSESHKKQSIIEKLLNKFAPNLMLHRKAEPLPLKINWRRIFILPTKPGLFFGFIAFLMLIASLNFNNNMGLMMTFLLVGLAQVALYRVFFNLRNIVIKQVTAQPVFLGQKATYVIHFSSEENKYDICVKNETEENCLIELTADEHCSIPCRLETRKRGWLNCGKIKILSSFPFGLFYAWVWVRIDTQCLVYPRPETHPPPFPINQANEGETTVIKYGEDFHGLKPYQSGDSMRLIAWKRTAQIGELISREYQHTQGKKLLLDFHQIHLQSLEEKISRLTAWVLKAYQQQHDYCLKLPDFDSGFGYSTQHHLSCLKALALYGNES